MQRLQLDVNVREGKGRGAARRLRADGGVPAVLYGSGVAGVPLAIEGQVLERVLRSGSNALIDLQGANEVKGKLVLVKDIQRHPVSQRLIHCDLYAVDTKKKLHVDVPIHIEGKAPGVEQGGILNVLARNLEISCLPLAIPDTITVDVSELNIGDQIRLSDITLPEGAEALIEETSVLVTVNAPRVEEEETPAEGAEGEEAAAEGAAAEGAAPTAEDKKEGGGD